MDTSFTGKGQRYLYFDFLSTVFHVMMEDFMFQITADETIVHCVLEV